MRDRDINANVPKGAETGEAAEENAGAELAAREDAEVKKLATDLEEMRQALLRHQADFANYRKRAEKENREAAQRATARVIEALIPVVDGFEHALAAHREEEYEAYRKGFELIYRQLLDHLARLGAERIDPLGKPFDPHLHQAVERAETTEYEDGTILAVFQPGYVFHGRALRPAMVRVAVHPAGASNRAVN
jgi:molecular chaperone GrpE